MARSHLLRFQPRRALLSLLAALVLVPVFALITKAVVEGVSPLAYEIHWLETVPFLILGTALVLNALWNERAAKQQGDEPDEPG